MEIKTLQQQIEERAKIRFMDDYKRSLQLIQNDPVFSKIEIKIGVESLRLSNIYDVSGVLFTQYGCGGRPCSENTNLAEVKEELIARYIEEETKKILDAFDNIQDLMSAQGNE